MSNDIVVDGTHAASFFEDVTNYRNVGGVYLWTARDSATAVTLATVPSGVATDCYGLNRLVGVLRHRVVTCRVAPLLPAHRSRPQVLRRLAVYFWRM
ncbi:MAG: hypothetical protein WBP11_03095, partial [Dokdonella sp.]